MMVSVIYRGHTAIDEAFLRMHFGRRQAHFIGVGRASVEHPMQDVMHIIIVTDEFQERLLCGARLAYTQQVLGR